MKKLLKFIMHNKLLVLLLILITVFFVFCLKLVFLFTESDTGALYGSRLDGIENVQFKDSSMESKIKELLGEAVPGVSIRTQGRIVNIIITLSNESDRNFGKDMAYKTISEGFSEEERNYYDFQVFVKKDNSDDAQLPIVGYKHHTKDGIIWTQDR